ncbi:hypothetical protein [Bacillus sp. 2205SS5-2]|uniref:hypothetical protein n=1 Tax=Bacillus sp. 2205SS5-2 TaxID=3109031 RepID=UPI003004689F
MGLVSLVAEYGTGPAGWIGIGIGIALYYGEARATLGGLASTVFVTYSRLSLSRYAAQYCQNFRDILYYKNWGTVSIILVNGF